MGCQSCVFATGCISLNSIICQLLVNLWDHWRRPGHSYKSLVQVSMCPRQIHQHILYCNAKIRTGPPKTNQNLKEIYCISKISVIYSAHRGYSLIRKVLLFCGRVYDQQHLVQHVEPPLFLSHSCRTAVSIAWRNVYPLALMSGILMRFIGAERAPFSPWGCCLSSRIIALVSLTHATPLSLALWLYWHKHIQIEYCQNTV